MEDSFSSYGKKWNLWKHFNYLPLILLLQKLNTFTDYGRMQCFFLILFVENFIHVHVKYNITKKLSFLGLKFGIGKPL